MTTRRWLATALMGTTLLALSPATSWAGPGDSTARAASLHAAIKTAAAQAAATPALQMIPTRTPAPSDKGIRKNSSGGGGHVMMVMTVLGTVAGIGATVYMVKQMQKTQKQLTTPNQ